MNNKERTIWLSGLLLISACYVGQSSKVSDLETLDSRNNLNYRIQSDQISELTFKIEESRRNGYAQGVTEGKNQALIMAIKGEPLNDYADGYHAAIELHHDLEIDLYETIIDLITENTSIEESYLNILDLVAKDEN